MGKQKGKAAAIEPAAGIWRKLASHPLRHQLAGEVHARPFLPIGTPRRIVQFAFLTDEQQARADRESIGRLYASRGLEAPAQAKFLALDLGSARLRWEQHTEFTTYAFDMPADARRPFAPVDFSALALGRALEPPGELISACEVALIRAPRAGMPHLGLFDESSLCMSEVDEGAARISTDFRVRPDGATRILIEDRDLGDRRAGALVQRLVEIETYRVLALMGLPEANRLQPIVYRIEQELAEVMARMRTASGFEDNRALLDRLTTLASDLEAEATATSYRFGASRAYSNIVDQRIRVLGEQPVRTFRTWEAFLRRRMNPAMQTCCRVEERQSELAQRLSRAANLLRTRVDIELEQQNRALLESMNRRAKMQLRLQQTVEGLSVAAVSYYVVGLIAYLVKGAGETALPLPAGLVEALSVPVVVLVIWLIVRRIRRVHARD